MILRVTSRLWTAGTTLRDVIGSTVVSTDPAMSNRGFLYGARSVSEVSAAIVVKNAQERSTLVKPRSSRRWPPLAWHFVRSSGGQYGPPLMIAPDQDAKPRMRLSVPASVAATVDPRLNPWTPTRNLSM